MTGFHTLTADRRRQTSMDFSPYPILATTRTDGPGRALGSTQESRCFKFSRLSDYRGNICVGTVKAEGAAQIVMLTLCSSRWDRSGGAGSPDLCKCRGSRLRVLRFPSEQSALQSRDQTSDEQHSGRQNGHAREYSGRIKNTLGLSNEVANTP